MSRHAAAAVALLLAAPVLASEPPVVQVLKPEAVEMAAGEEAVARIHVRVKPGYHVQANPVLDAALIPITLDVASGVGLEAGPARYPTPRRLRLQGAEDELVVLDGHFAIEMPLRARPDTAPGTASLAGTLRYQACDDERCLFPRTLPVELAVRVRVRAR